MYLTFSDSAKFAEAARSLLMGQGLTIHHSFFSQQSLASYTPGQSWQAGFLPLPSLILSLVFRIFPVTDLTVALTGLTLFTICVILTFLIARKLHSTFSAFIAVILLASSLFFHEFALNATSEIFFTTEILLFTYLILQSSKVRWLSAIPLSLMFITRQQAVVFLLSVIFSAGLLLSTTYSKKLSVLFFSTIIFFGIFKFSKIDVSSIYFPLKPLYSVQISTSQPQGQYLRGEAYSPSALSVKTLVSKVIYNLYNFAKTPDRLTSPVVFFLALSACFHRPFRRFAHFSWITLGLFTLAASITLPNARYIHPTLPLIFICAAVGLAQIPHKLLAWLTILLIVLPTLGHLTLDARFRRQQFNYGQPPVYKVISDVMAQHIPKGKLVITNLDAWAAWYEGLTTMWFPLSPDMLSGYENKVNFIVITNYKEQDGDFTLGPWREVVYSPENITNTFLAKNYQILTTFTITPDKVYENQPFQGTILVRK